MRALAVVGKSQANIRLGVIRIEFESFLEQSECRVIVLTGVAVVKFLTLKVIVPLLPVDPELVAVFEDGRVTVSETLALETGLLFWSKTVTLV